MKKRRKNREARAAAGWVLATVMVLLAGVVGTRWERQGTTPLLLHPAATPTKGAIELQVRKPRAHLTPAPTLSGEEARVLLARGTSGERVRLLQKGLLEAGYLEGEPDGVFGEQTELAVRCYQSAHGLLPTGEVNGALWRTLVHVDFGEAEPSPTPEGDLVWVSVRGGVRYHKTPGCSRMQEARSLTVEEAVSQGYSPCNRCY